jgi:hypothetical protein
VVDLSVAVETSVAAVMAFCPEFHGHHDQLHPSVQPVRVSPVVKNHVHAGVDHAISACADMTRRRRSTVSASAGSLDCFASLAITAMSNPRAFLPSKPLPRDRDDRWARQEPHKSTRHSSLTN